MRSQRCVVVALLTLVAAGRATPAAAVAAPIGRLDIPPHSPRFPIYAADALQGTTMAGRVAVSNPHTGEHAAERNPWT
ncbi:hypothetical protein [Mycobacterium sp. SA01]|uniref:hypothetical protein n=1 Tax=Mycobacterium sp. SA01 TaxID=3238820 RepID=UPI00351B7170